MKPNDNQLKDIFNDIFPSLKGKEKTPENVEEAFSELVSSNKDDYLIYQFHLFFYPNDSSSEKNKPKEFWFQKHKSNQPQLYTEYNFALDVLEVLKSYLKNKDSKAADSIIYDLALKFGAYKNIDYYLLLTQNKIINNLIHVYSFLHKDKQYFKNILKVDVYETDDLTDKKTQEKLFVGKTITKEEIVLHKFYTPILNEFKGEINDLKKEVNFQKVIIDELMQFKEEATNKFDQIYLRDTIKYSIKYIYRMFYSKFHKELKDDFKTNVYEEINQLQNILSDKSFDKYSFLKDYIDAIYFGDLMALNKVSHPSLDNRKLEDIKKYVDNNKPYLDRVVQFLKNLPKLQDYINLEINNYFSKDKLEEEIRKAYNFEKIYDDNIKV